MSDIVIAIKARHADDEAAGPFVGRRSEQARLDRGALLAEIARLCEERRSITTLLGKVETLEADNARLREERRWIPVVERLPPFGADVLTLSFFSDGVPLVCIGWHNGQEWMHYTGRGPGLPVSHWQPLPPGPEANG